MFALYKKYKDGYHVEVEIIAVSGDKNELMALLPYEVEKYLRERNEHMLPFELIRYYLPNGHEPTDGKKTRNILKASALKISWHTFCNITSTTQV